MEIAGNGGKEGTVTRVNGVFSAVVNGGVEDSVMGSGLP